MQELGRGIKAMAPNFDTSPTSLKAQIKGYKQGITWNVL
jgi:hypothetical protein